MPSPRSTEAGGAGAAGRRSAPRDGPRPGRSRAGRAATLPVIAALLLGACRGVNLAGDALTSHATGPQRQACQQAVLDELARREVPVSSVRRVHFQARYAQRNRGSDRIIGFDAWVYPKKGTGALVIQLSESCRVQRAWIHGDGA